jgi:xanthine dehydrogenase molybdenum-binding subunit
VGEAIAAVAAETEELAEKALNSIKVEFEQLRALFDAVEAMKPENPLIHETILFGQEEIQVRNNIAATREIVEGNIEEGFKEAEIILEDEFKTGRVYHAQMETKSVVCQPEADGGITVWTTTQTIHNCEATSWRDLSNPPEQGECKTNCRGWFFWIEHSDEFDRSHWGGPCP